MALEVAWLLPAPPEAPLEAVEELPEHLPARRVAHRVHLLHFHLGTHAEERVHAGEELGTRLRVFDII